MFPLPVSSWGGLAQRVRAARGPMTGSGVTCLSFVGERQITIFANPPYGLQFTFVVLFHSSLE